MSKLINWKIFFILLVASVGSTFAIIPYMFTIQKDLISQIPFPIPVLMLIQGVQTTILYSILIFIGLLLAKKTGFSFPILERITSKKPIRDQLRSIIPRSILIGLLVGFLIAGVDYLFIQFGVQIPGSSVAAPLWQKFLASFYGGIAEEVMMRLFLMTLLAWIFSKVFHKSKKPSAIHIYPAIFITAIVFGLGHLPVTATFTEITPQIIFRGILLNGIGGVVYGWLFWKKGFESAVVAHYMTDIALLIIVPALINLII